MSGFFRRMGQLSRARSPVRRRLRAGSATTSATPEAISLQVQAPRPKGSSIPRPPAPPARMVAPVEAAVPLAPKGGLTRSAIGPDPETDAKDALPPGRREEAAKTPDPGALYPETLSAPAKEDAPTTKSPRSRISDQIAPSPGPVAVPRKPDRGREDVPLPDSRGLAIDVAGPPPVKAPARPEAPDVEPQLDLLRTDTPAIESPLRQGVTEIEPATTSDAPVQVNDPSVPADDALLAEPFSVPEIMTSPPERPQREARVEVNIGTVTVSTDPEQSTARPQPPSKPPKPRFTGIWSGRRSLSRAYVRGM